MAKKAKGQTEEELAALAAEGFDDDPPEDPLDGDDEPPAPKAKKAKGGKKDKAKKAPAKKAAPDGLSPNDVAKEWKTTGAAVRKALRKVAKDHPSKERWTFNSLGDPVLKAAHAQLLKDAEKAKEPKKSKPKAKAKKSKKS